MVKYVRGLKFEEEPDYDYFRKQIAKMYKHNSIHNDGKFDWIDRMRSSIGRPAIGASAKGHNGKTTDTNKRILNPLESKKDTIAEKNEESKGEANEKCNLL